MKQLSLSIGKEQLAIIQLNFEEEIPEMKKIGNFWAVFRTHEEITLILPEKYATSYKKSELGWRYLKIDGIFDFNQIGILRLILNPLAEGNISILTFSTYDTDYILIKKEDLEKAVDILVENGHVVEK